jgi:hypothetical protein
MKAFINRDKLNDLLESRRFTWLTSKLKDMGIKVEYKHLMSMVNGNSNIHLSVAMGICKIFNVKVEDLFELK